MKLDDKVTYNEKMVGKHVLVVQGLKQWRGVVTKVIDGDTLEVEDFKSRDLYQVDIFNIRAL